MFLLWIFKPVFALCNLECKNTFNFLKSQAFCLLFAILRAFVTQWGISRSFVAPRSRKIFLRQHGLQMALSLHKHMELHKKMATTHRHDAQLPHRTYIEMKKLSFPYSPPPLRRETDCVLLQGGGKCGCYIPTIAFAISRFYYSRLLPCRVSKCSFQNS